MSITISIPDAMRQSVEAASGGRNTILFDDKGQPSVMVVIPRFNLEDVDPSLGSGVHPAFIIDGETKSEIFISKFENVITEGRALSINGVHPANTLTMGEAMAACTAKGQGWHLMTNAEWAALSIMCYKNGFIPRGNTNQGKDILKPWLTGIPTERPGFVKTGSGPVDWFHDGTYFGVADLNGNMCEMVFGLRNKNGEIQIIPDNNASTCQTEANIDLTVGPWRAIMPDASLVAPGTTGTIKINLSGGVIDFATSNTGFEEAWYNMHAFTSTGVGVAGLKLLKALGIFPWANGVNLAFLSNYQDDVYKHAFRGSGRDVGQQTDLLTMLWNGSSESSSDALSFRACHHIP